MDPEPNVYTCNRCVRTFDTKKIVQGVYGTRHCNKCINELLKHEIQDRVRSWNSPLSQFGNQV
jgi:hypothetical protein